MYPPGARPSRLPTSRSAPSRTYTLFVCSNRSADCAVDVVATRRYPAYSSSENWFRSHPETSPDAMASIVTPATETLWTVVHVVTTWGARNRGLGSFHLRNAR